ncbi:MAG: hypothetical protein ACM3KL_07775 [Alphaproteobacteria bacterium]
MKIATDPAVEQFANSEHCCAEDEFEGPFVEKSAVCCLIIVITFLAFSAAALIT